MAKAVVTVEGLVEQGNNALSKLQPELAVKFFQRARAIRPDDTNVMDALADVHLQLGDQEEALELLLMSKSLAPEANPFKWLYLAQLQNGLDAVTTYSKAISILEALLQAESADTDVRFTDFILHSRNLTVEILYVLPILMNTLLFYLALFAVICLIFVVAIVEESSSKSLLQHWRTIPH